MADDVITITTQLTLDNSGLKAQVVYSGIKANQTDQEMVRNTQPLGATPEALDLGDVQTPGFMIAKNLHDTDSIFIGPVVSSAATMEDFIEIGPGEPFLGRLAGAPYGKGTGNNPKLDYTILGA